MGINIALEGENGDVLESVTDGRNLRRRLLPSDTRQPCPLLGFIDPYGDTVFNRLQMDQFLAEWKTVADRATTEEERVLVTGVGALAERCKAGVHLYLKFIGD
jgi:hypothetical protein